MAGDAYEVMWCEDRIWVLMWTHKNTHNCIHNYLPSLGTMSFIFFSPWDTFNDAQ